MYKKFSLLLIFLLLLVSVGCSDLNNSSNSNTGPITVKSQDNLVTLYVPPDSVPGGTQLNIKKLDNLNMPEGAVGVGYDIGPDGTQFSEPASLTYTYQSNNIDSLDPENLILAVYKNDCWQLLETTHNPDNNTLTASLTHLCPVGMVCVNQNEVSMYFGNENKSSFILPPGAILNDTEFIITELSKENIGILDDQLPQPAGTLIIGYNIEINSESTPIAQFAREADLTLYHDPDKLLVNEPEDLALYTYNDGSWKQLPTTLDSDSNTVSTSVLEPGIFAIIGTHNLNDQPILLMSEDEYFSLDIPAMSVDASTEFEILKIRQEDLPQDALGAGYSINPTDNEFYNSATITFKYDPEYPTPQSLIIGRIDNNQFEELPTQLNQTTNTLTAETDCTGTFGIKIQAPVQTYEASYEPVADITIIKEVFDLFTTIKLCDGYYQNTSELAIIDYPDTNAYCCLKFDISDIPDTANIKSAWLILRALWNDGYDGTIGVYKILNQWQEPATPEEEIQRDPILAHEIPYAEKPILQSYDGYPWYWGKWIFEDGGTETRDESKKVDITELVREWHNGDTENYGLKLAQSQEVISGTMFFVCFDSRSAFPEIVRPQLFVEYEN